MVFIWWCSHKSDVSAFQLGTKTVNCCGFLSGKPAYEMLQSHPDWVPSLHLRHTEIKSTHTERFNWRTKRQQALIENNTALAAQMDEAVPQDGAGRDQRAFLERWWRESQVLHWTSMFCCCDGCADTGSSLPTTCTWGWICQSSTLHTSSA